MVAQRLVFSDGKMLKFEGNHSSETTDYSYSHSCHSETKQT